MKHASGERNILLTFQDMFVGDSDMILRTVVVRLPASI